MQNLTAPRANEIKNILTYWRNSLSDADRMGIGNSKLKDGRFVQKGEVLNGVINQKTTTDFFDRYGNKKKEQGEQEKSKNPIPVSICPFLLKLKFHHANQNQSMLETMAPVWIAAFLDAEGNLQPNLDILPWIPRNLLEPTQDDRFIVSSIGKVDTFLAHNEPPTKGGWQAMWQFTNKMLEKVTNRRLSMAHFKHQDYQMSEEAVVIADKRIQGASSHVRRLYDSVLKTNQMPLLLKTYVSKQDNQLKPLLNQENQMKLSRFHVGQMTKSFPLSPSQRETLHHFFETEKGEIMAVNGPPGTGKTTLLQSVISTLWIDSAVKGIEPPVIAAASTNNQAVTNIIESFGKITDQHDQDVLSGRWIPDFHTYGLYCPSKTEESKNQKFFTPGKMKILENEDYINKAQSYFIDRFQAYSNQTPIDIKEATAHLQEELIQHVKNMESTIDAWEQKVRFEKEITEKYKGKKLGEYLQILKAQRSQLHHQNQRASDTYDNWAKHVSSEPFWITIFSFLPSVKKKIKIRDRNFLNQAGIDIKMAADRQKLTDYFEAQLRNLKDEGISLDSKIDQVEQDKKREQETRNNFHQACEKVHVDSRKILHSADLLKELDMNQRYRAFQLSTHYWEGCWLAEVRNQLNNKNFKETKWPSKQKKRWHRYAKLTPCMVSTFYMLPSYFTAWKGNTPCPLYEFIDLLIVDEAGQVTPEIAGASFSLAKSALVVGDTLQIEPVWNITENVDLANALQDHVLPTKYDEKTKEWFLKSSGLSASAGSVMRIAQRQSGFQKNEGQRGMFLSEHRRSVPEIIRYCNELAYNDNLTPARKGIKNHPLPHMGYAHVPGQSKKYGSSHGNIREVEVIARWIVDHKNQLENKYERKIDEIIGVITPFAKQREFIERALRKREIQGLTVGTVHALQGAERDIIIFSSVYGNQYSGSFFFDQGPNMLNVAVSRAKDSFLVFGDMSNFQPNAQSPSGLLAKYLFADESNEITNIIFPKRREITKLGVDLRHLGTLEEHRKALRYCIENARKHLIIVSPYLSSNAIESDQLTSLIKPVINKGIKIDVYIDDQLNRDPSGNIKQITQKAVHLLSDIGVLVKTAVRIHNKTICVDHRILIEGSFNWLSAQRDPHNIWQRYESSLVYEGPGTRQFIDSTIREMEKRVNLIKHHKRRVDE